MQSNYPGGWARKAKKKRLKMAKNKRFVPAASGSAARGLKPVAGLHQGGRWMWAKVRGKAGLLPRGGAGAGE